MSCSEWRGQIIELARGRWPDSGSLPEAEKRKRAMAHASVCPECSRLLEGQRALTAACREFARETPAAPPADL
ncbi:MAG TPA: hypothetical protein VHC72_17000, partial [Bryobacteraceae bacterium]|nr:hypothetical protein [Bryobacteraceae bacterium]